MIYFEATDRRMAICSLNIIYGHSMYQKLTPTSPGCFCLQPLEGDENSSAEFRLSNLAGDFRLDD